MCYVRTSTGCCFSKVQTLTDLLPHCCADNAKSAQAAKSTHNGNGSHADCCADTLKLCCAADGNSLSSQVSEAAVHVHIQPVDPNTPRANRGSAISLAGQGPGLQVFPGSVTEVDCVSAALRAGCGTLTVRGFGLTGGCIQKDDGDRLSCTPTSSLALDPKLLLLIGK